MWMVLTLFASLQGTVPPVHTWIADLKTARDTLRGRVVSLEGDVVDIRTTSPTSRRGMYRVIDASDRTGVLVRSDMLPVDGGSFRIRARVAAEPGAEGTLLLDELERDRTDARPLAPVMATGLSGVLFLLVAILLGQLLRDERRHMVAPPLWLLPEAGPYGKAGNGSPQPATLAYEPELEEADRRKREQFRRRKRSLIVALIGSLVITGTSAAWVLDTRTTAPQVPAFILVDATDGMPVRTAPPAPAPPDSALQDQPRTVQLDSAAVRLAPPRSARIDSALPRRAPTVAAARPSSTGVAASQSPVVATPVPAPQPVAPAPPPPPAPEPAPPPATEPVRRNPEEERSLADAALADAVSRLVAAINAKSAVQLAGLVPEAMADDPDRRERFLKFVREFTPKAIAGAVTDRTFAEERAEAKFSVTLVWRGDFGVERRKTGSFAGVARRQDAGWRFEGARLLDALP